MSASSILLIPGAIGELTDKITILEIKAERIKDPAKLANVCYELQLLRTLESEQVSVTLEHARLTSELRAVNVALWDIEDTLREHEARADFGPEFVEHARSVFKTNDRRAEIKRQMNELHGSKVIEEKSYRG